MNRIYLILLGVILVSSLVGASYDILIYAITLLSLFKLIEKFGNGITLREIMVVYSCLIYLVMPLLGYRVYTNDNSLANIWVKYMPIGEKRYFEFVFPAITVFAIGLFLPASKATSVPDEKSYLTPIILQGKEILKSSPYIWLPLFVLGTFAYFFRVFLSFSALTFILQSCYLLLFSALIYIYFTPNLKYKKVFLASIVLMILFEAIQTGMFTVLVYMGVVVGSIIFIGSKVPLWKKLLLIPLSFFLIVSLQATKGSFRKKSWNRNYEGSKTELFVMLMTENLGNYNVMFSKESFFPIYARMNQGFNTALVMKRIPAVQDFDYGNSIYLTVLSSFVPRFLWPDKLESGGVYNMKHFTGYRIRGWSTNIGPLGEAYGNFGVLGGIIYMFIFGVFIRFVFFKIISLSKKYPLLLFWIPILFFEVSYSMENDTLQALNSIIKVGAFMLFFFWVYPKIFGRTGGKIKLQSIGSLNPV